MPIEIREIIIKGTVIEDEAPVVADTEESPVAVPFDKSELIEEIIHEVFKILEDKNYR